jgi:hypothetical protein
MEKKLYAHRLKSLLKLFASLPYYFRHSTQPRRIVYDKLGSKSAFIKRAAKLTSFPIDMAAEPVEIKSLSQFRF